MAIEAELRRVTVRLVQTGLILSMYDVALHSDKSIPNFICQTVASVALSSIKLQQRCLRVRAFVRPYGNHSFGAATPSGSGLQIDIWVMTAVNLPDSSQSLPVLKVRPYIPASVVCSLRCHLVMSGGVRKRKENSREETAATSHKNRWAVVRRVSFDRMDQRGGDSLLNVRGRNANAPSIKKAVAASFTPFLLKSISSRPFHHTELHLLCIGSPSCVDSRFTSMATANCVAIAFGTGLGS